MSMLIQTELLKPNPKYSRKTCDSTFVVMCVWLSDILDIAHVVLLNIVLVVLDDLGLLEFVGLRVVIVDDVLEVISAEPKPEQRQFIYSEYNNCTSVEHVNVDLSFSWLNFKTYRSIKC